MPVTAKLSKHFYDVLGKDVASELAEAVLRADMHRGFAQLHASLLRWMFGFWATSTLTLAGLMLAVLAQVR